VHAALACVVVPIVKASVAVPLPEVSVSDCTKPVTV
jgi:hypothetical protein